ncbi:MAG: hypothetical protein JKX85_04670 [Phycisphaeraceae bacterium]|nr:hypothetical protein [Phycisphaeraceae bacterium]
MIERTITSNDIALKALRDALELSNLTMACHYATEQQLKDATKKAMCSILKNIKQAIATLEAEQAHAEGSQPPNAGSLARIGDVEKGRSVTDTPPFSKEHGEMVESSNFVFFACLLGVVFWVIITVIETF